MVLGCLCAVLGPWLGCVLVLCPLEESDALGKCSAFPRRIPSQAARPLGALGPGIMGSKTRAPGPQACSLGCRACHGASAVAVPG